MTEPTLESVARSQDRTLILLEQLSTKVSQRIEHTDSWRERTDLILMGDGNGRKGHNVRLDRLEQRAAAQQWLLRILVGGMALAILDRLVGVLG